MNSFGQCAVVFPSTKSETRIWWVFAFTGIFPFQIWLECAAMLLFVMSSTPFGRGFCLFVEQSA